MTPSMRKIAIVVTAHVVFLLLFLLGNAGMLALPEEILTGSLFRLRGEVPAKNRILIAGIDEASLEELGDWPWSRTQSAQLISALSGMGAKAIYMDILYPDRSDEAADRALIKATRNAGNVIHLYVFEDHNTDVLHPPLAGLKEASAVMADARILTGPTGNVRQAAPFGGKGMVPMGGVAAAALVWDMPPEKLRENLPETIGVNFLGAAPFATLSAADIIMDRLTPGQKSSVKDAVVLVGLTATNLAMDSYGTPFTPQTPGLQIHATLCDNILTGDYMVFTKGWVADTVVYVIALLTALLFLLSGRTGIIGGLVILPVILIACFASFQRNILPPLAAYLAAWLLSFLSGLVLTVRR